MLFFFFNLDIKKGLNFKQICNHFSKIVQQKEKLFRYPVSFLQEKIKQNKPTNSGPQEKNSINQPFLMIFTNKKKCL